MNESTTYINESNQCCTCRDDHDDCSYCEFSRENEDYWSNPDDAEMIRILVSKGTIEFELETSRYVDFDQPFSGLCIDSAASMRINQPENWTIERI